MLPQTQVTRPNRPKRPAPASGNPLLPNGTYSSQPSTGLYGNQGSTYAMLPAVNVNNLPLGSQGTPDFTMQPTQQAAPFMTAPQARGAGLMSQRQTQPYSILAGNNPYRPQQQVSPFYTQNQLSGDPIAQAFGVGVNQQTGIDNAMMRIANGDASQLSPAERTALEAIITGQGSGTEQQSGGGGNADFANTQSQQYYAANGIGFYDQQRWDPERKKYVKIGDLIRQGKLDVKTGKFYANGKNKKGRPKSQGGGGSPAQQTSQPIPSFGVVNMNINTATG